MLADIRAGSASFEQSCRRLRVAGLAVVLATALSAAGLAGASVASAATLVTHSAKSGELGGGRLTLHGVSGRVSYAISGGRSGTMSVRRLHRRLFLPGLPATGRLRVAGQRGGDPRFKLSKPRYNAAQHTVSYRAKPLAKRRAGIRALRDFGAAKLSIVPHQRLGSGGNGGNVCEIVLQNKLRNIEGVQLASSSKWDTDEWEPAPPTYEIVEGYGADWLSAGGLARGCSNTTTWNITSGDTGTFTLSVTWNWGSTGPSHSCTSSNPNYKCLEDDQSGTINYDLCPVSATPATCNDTTPAARR
jgi:hypothetical protein